ncbi:hypothetical protein NCS57_00959700 [Fusarium keratoplasticum]|uniref:Uncharacterized protein n=1 Tax=Fusarium keratoplasticum TaxID=1328300 RepID=A0ACC0QTW7_9HYPO|nr:hypothetical protein NCS57_00959700 [Fusarium keratoplasticum]KAI8663582.1 hypothetical protein NCS57_00959700 [Fusarium keratoplasticum]KAI8664228.1 hypothetical protein NCS55_00931000 [Fusarium keratoplasticum]
MVSFSATNVVVDNRYAWPAEKTCLKVRFLGGSSWERKTVEHYVTKYYHEVPMRVRFEFLDDDASVPSDIRIRFGHKNRSRVGRNAQKYPDLHTMELNLYPPSHLSRDEQQDRRRRSILHMFGHALGIQLEYDHSGKSDTVASQSDDFWSTLSDITSGVDQRSIMHCQVGECNTSDGEEATGPFNTTLSDGDKKLLATMYPRCELRKPAKAPARTLKPSPKPATKSAATKSSKSLQRPRDEYASAPVAKANHTSVEGCDPSKATVISGCGTFNVDGGGYVTLSGCGNVWVDGNGYAEISGVGKVCFSGTGTGMVTGIGEICSHVSMKK